MIIMKAYLYYSKNKIPKINHLEQVKRSIASAISDSLILSRPLSGEDVEVQRAKISHSIDIYLVLNQTPTMNPSDLADKMDEIKKRLGQIFIQDQGVGQGFLIRTKIDPDHNGILNTIQTHNEDGADQMQSGEGGESELDYNKRAKLYIAVDPAYSFDRVILSADVKEKIESALNILRFEKKVFDEWGLYEIQPHPSSSLSFFGPSGTGKTMAAEAVAQMLGKKILKVSYADVESKFHGEGPKMVKAIFLAAEQQDAVLFFDEADSLLSKRLTNVSQGSEQAINSMRSQLLICLEEFRGIVIFATNLVVNYDSAFLTRLISVEFKMPDAPTRKQIWDVHIRPADDGKDHMLCIPLAEDIDTLKLAEEYAFAGREIRNAVISACVKAVMEKRDVVQQSDFHYACEKIIQEKNSIARAGDSVPPAANMDVVKKAIVDRIKEGGDSHVSAAAE